MLPLASRLSPPAINPHPHYPLRIPRGGGAFTFPIAAPPPFHDRMLRGTARCVCLSVWGGKRPQWVTPLWRRRGLNPPNPAPSTPCGSIQTLVCIVLYLYVDVRPSRLFFFFCFVFVKKNSPLGTITTTILITLNYYYPYLLPVAPVYFDILLFILFYFSVFLLKLCCVALPTDRSFSVFITVKNDRARLESRRAHTYTHIHRHKQQKPQTHTGARYTVKRLLQIRDGPFTLM